MLNPYHSLGRKNDQVTSDIDVFRTTINTASALQRNMSSHHAPYVESNAMRKGVSSSLSFKAHAKDSLHNESLDTEPRISGIRTNNTTSIGFNQNRGTTTTLKMLDSVSKPNKIISYQNSSRVEIRQQHLVAQKKVSINDEFNYKLVHNNNP